MVKVQGERWFPSEKTFSDEISELWGNWYCDSEVGRLRSVLLRRPGKEIENITDHNYSEYRWKAPMIPERARAQQDALVQIYLDHGVQVHYVQEQREDRPNALFMRDLVFMTPEGAIVCRPGISAKARGRAVCCSSPGKLGSPHY